MIYIYTRVLQVYTKTIIYTDNAMRTRIKWIVYSSTFWTNPWSYTCLWFLLSESSTERNCRNHKKERNCHNNSTYEPLNDIIIIIFLFFYCWKCRVKEVLMFTLIEILFSKYLYKYIRNVKNDIHLKQKCWNCI